MGNADAWWIALAVFLVMLAVGLLSRIPVLLFDTVSNPEHDETAPPTDAP
jgi:hypothetical protein